MIRAVMAVMAGLLCTLAGVKYASALRGDAGRLERWCPLLSHLALLLREGTLSIPEALCAAANGPHSPDKLLQKIAGRLASSPMTTLSEAFVQCCDDWVEKEVLLRLFTRLGRGSKENRIQAVEQSADEIRLLAQSASVKAEKDARLWQTLGFVGGLCLTILLL